MIFATAVTLMFVPALYLALEDGKARLSRIGAWLRGGQPGLGEAQPPAS